jgi:hypothetical protein
LTLMGWAFAIGRTRHAAHTRNHERTSADRTGRPDA